MSTFTRLSLIQFRNYTQATYRFDKRIVAIAGPNGSGKTNLLDAIYYLCFTRSYFNRPDSKNAQHGMEGFRLESNIQDGAGSPHQSDISCVVRPGGKKEFLFDQVPYERFSEHIGRIPAIMIAPDDAILITGGSEERRKFADQVLSQTDYDYLCLLIQYNKILQQRNALLKSGQTITQMEGVLQVLDQQLSHVATPIFEKRKAFFAGFIPEVITQYQAIAGHETLEALQLDFQSQLLTSTLAELLHNSQQRDVMLQRTTKGIHRDDLNITLDNQPFKTLASQGQRKSLLFALKLAAYYYIARQKSNPPVLLLDDVFEKLDQQRMLNLLSQVSTRIKGQVFITDTHSERLKAAFDQLAEPYQLIELQAPDE
ncbi:DNA replication/repair protein RecF [Arachidicoccus rhizosphaerae]|uniref:DNA replication/repair protein RecF n=1 Tax=Arachidicoccus rhizosphaerae TaxID=551991 RepID=UPI000B843F24|nr:DNA replication and repair protein RecF [Arachidicoccus rhizosphaerae]